MENTEKKASITLQTIIEVVHITIAIIFAMTSYAPMVGAFGVVGYILGIVAIDVHAYVQGAIWMRQQPGNWRSGRVWSCIVLTCLSAGISLFGSKLTAEIFVDQNQIARLEESNAKHEDDVFEYNAQAQMNYDDRLATAQAEADKKNKAAQERYDAKTERLKEAIEEQERLNPGMTAWKARRNLERHEATTPEIFTPRVVSKPQFKVVNKSKIKNNNSTINKLQNRTGMYQSFAIVIESGLFIVLILFLIGVQKDEPHDNFIARYFDPILDKSKMTKHQMLIALKSALDKVRFDRAQAEEELIELQAQVKAQNEKIIKAQNRAQVEAQNRAQVEAQNEKLRAQVEAQVEAQNELKKRAQTLSQLESAGRRKIEELESALENSAPQPAPYSAPKKKKTQVKAQKAQFDASVEPVEVQNEDGSWSYKIGGKIKNVKQMGSSYRAAKSEWEKEGSDLAKIRMEYYAKWRESLKELNKGKVVQMKKIS